MRKDLGQNRTDKQGRTWNELGVLLKHPVDKNGCLSLWVSHQKKTWLWMSLAIPPIGGILTGKHALISGP